MKFPLHILHLEDDPLDAALVQSTLEAGGITCSVTRVQDRADFLAALERRDVDLVLADLALPAFDGMSALQIVREKWPNVPFILVSGRLGEELAIESLKSGATDYVLKERLSRLVPAVRRTVQEVRERVERARAEEALRFSEMRYRRLFESAKDGIAVLNAKTGRIIDANPFLMDLLGYSREELLGRRLWEISSFKDTELCKTAFFELQTVDYISYGDLPLETKDGRRRDVEFVSNAYLAEHERVIQCNIRDITERKRVEERLRGLQAQLEQTNRELVMRNQEAQYFYHTLSHELKTPLTSAHEFVSIVMDGLAGAVNETQLNYLRIAKESCTQLSVYINDLLDATRLETGKLHIELKPASVEAVVQRAITMIQPEAAAKKIHLSAELDGNLPNAVVDKSRILQILTNLLNNAVKFTPEGGSIVVKLGPDPKRPDHVRISVADTGCGIPKDQIERIFERLYQVKAGDITSQGGIGLGLYLCRELVFLHGGNIWVESELGKGSTFSFVIPKQSVTKGGHVPIVGDQYEIGETLRLAREAQNEIGFLNKNAKTPQISAVTSV